MMIGNRIALAPAVTFWRTGVARRRAYAGLLATTIVADLVAMILAVTLTLAVHPAADLDALLALSVLCGAVWVALGVRSGLYRQMVVRVALLDIPVVLSTMLQGSALVLILLGLLGTDTALLALLGTLVPVAILCRIATRSTAQTAVRHVGSRTQSRMLVVGGGVVAQRLAATLIKYRDLGITVVGFVDDYEYGHGVRHVLALPVFQGADLEHTIEQHNIDHVVFAFSHLPDSERIQLLRVCQGQPQLQVSLVPRLFEVTPANTRLFDVRGIPLVQFETSGLLLGLAIKRIVDIVVAGFGLLVALPVVAAAALAIRIEGRGPILFGQLRVGAGGEPFTMYKLRSMRAPRDGEDRASAARHTRVGGLLRKLGIDELPQLWNVLRGDMSLIGPRPEQEGYVELFTQKIPRYAERHRVRGGITGLSQVSRLRGDTSIIERTQLDNFYIDNWSLWLDVKIILATFTALIPTSQGIGGEAMFRDVIADVSQGLAPRGADSTRGGEGGGDGSDGPRPSTSAALARDVA